MHIRVRRIIQQSYEVQGLQKGFKNFRLSIVLLLALLLLALTSCGIATPVSSKVTGVGIGIGTPQPGTNGGPMVNPTGHSETIVATSNLAYVSSDNGTLYALRSSNGSVQWRYQIGMLVRGATVVNTVLYAYAGSSLYSFNAASGNLLWQHQVARDITNIIVSDTVIYADTTAEQNSPVVYALNSTQGAELWHYTANSISPGLLAVADGNIYYMETASIGINSNQSMEALRASDGHVLWHLHLDPSDGSGTVTQVNSIVYVATIHGAVYAVRASDGLLVWHVARPTVDIGFSLPVPPTIANGIVYTSSEQVIYALRASDGKQLWQFVGNNQIGANPLPFTLINGVVYATNNTGLVFALRASDGKLLWQRSNLVSQTLTVQNGHLYLFLDSSLNDVIVAINTDDGSPLWQHTLPPIPGGVTWYQPGVIAGNSMYIAGENGTVQALQTDNGILLWHYTITENAIPLAAPILSASVTFTASTSYTQALRLITDLGLHTYEVCLDGWKPAGGTDRFQNYGHGLLISATDISATNWYNRLQTNPLVSSLSSNPIFNCPMLTGSNTPPMLPASQVGTYVQVTFSPATNYDSALNAVNTLGFRLANPTYEQKRSKGPPAWSSMGQENSFAKTHTLILATTESNAAAWATQLKATPGVLQISDV